MPSHGMEDEDKPCRACSDFKSWAKSRTKATTEKSSPHKSTPTTTKSTPEPRDDCPLDKNELGTSTWGLLHSMAAYFPDKPSRAESSNMTRFFNIFAQFYPCEPCAIDFQQDIKENPPQTKSREELAKWLCERHNTVNKKLGKPQFDCSTVHERWRDGWKDGSCD